MEVEGSNLMDGEIRQIGELVVVDDDDDDGMNRSSACQIELRSRS
jgi:hypothetical protein